MADELEMISVNKIKDGAVDFTPLSLVDSGEVTGYQAQNTIQAGAYNGYDKSSVSLNSGPTQLSILPSGIIDVNGLPFVVKTTIVLTLPVTGNNWFLKVVDGSTSPPKKTIEFTNDRGTYDATKNGFYNTGGERVLNWAYNAIGQTLVKMKGIDFPQGEVIESNFPNSYVPMYEQNYSRWGVAGVSYAMPYSPINSVAFDSITGTLLAVGSNRIVYILNPDTGATLGTVDVSATVPNSTSIAFDRATGNMIIFNGSTNTVYVFTGITNTLSTSFVIATAWYITVNNNTGNLMSVNLPNSAISTIYEFNGISNSQINSYSVSSFASSASGLTYDENNDNLILVKDSSAVVYSGVTNTRLATAGTGNGTTNDVCYEGKNGRLFVLNTGAVLILANGYSK